MATAKNALNPARGKLFTLVVPMAAVALWVLLWQFGFIASVVAWLIAAATVKLYRQGAGGVQRTDAGWIVGMIVFSLVLAILSGMASDALAYYISESGGTVASNLLAWDFWDFFLANLMTAELWSSYAVDIAIAVAFCALGAYTDVRQLLAGPAPRKAA